MEERFSVGIGSGVILISLGLGAFFYTQTQTDDLLPAPVPVQTVQTAGRLVQQQALISADMRVLSTAPPLAGQWGRYAQGHLQPSADLRARFDLLLAQRGEQSLSGVRTRVQALATQELGADGGLAVTQVWDRYLALLAQDEAAQNSATAKTDTPEQWIASRLNFFSQAKARLGPDWGDVFFSEEEAQVRQLAQSIEQQKLQMKQRQEGN